MALLAENDLGATLFQLGMRGGNVKCLEERLLSNLPVGGNGNGFPPVVVHVGHGEPLENLAHRGACPISPTR